MISDNKRFRQLSREHNDLTEITSVWTKYKQAEEDIETAQAMLSDPDFKEMAQEEIKENKALIEQLEADLNILMIPKIRMMPTLLIWKSVPEPVVMKLRSSRVICSVCIANMRNLKAGVSKFCLKMKVSTVAIKKSSAW